MNTEIVTRIVDHARTPDARKAADILLHSGLTPEQLEARRAYHAQMAITVKSSEMADRERKVTEFRKDWNAPKRQLETKVEFIGKYAKWAGMLSALEERLESGFFFALIGTNGPGKTQLAVELMREMTYRLKSAKYDKAMGFFLSLKETFDGDKSSERQVLDDYAKPKLLVIDEFEKRGETTWHQNLLFYLLDRRYDAKLDTLIIANCTEPEFSALIGKSACDRMRETGGIITADWGSFR